jgi:hypothetical protein
MLMDGHSVYEGSQVSWQETAAHIEQIKSEAIEGGLDTELRCLESDSNDWRET